MLEYVFGTWNFQGINLIFYPSSVIHKDSQIQWTVHARLSGLRALVADALDRGDLTLHTAPGWTVTMRCLRVLSIA
jgi:hypothetical protein